MKRETNSYFIHNLNYLFYVALISVFVWLTYIQISKSALPLRGSWDPMFTAGNLSLNGVTYTGNFNQIGKMMFFCVNVQFPPTANLGTLGYQIILPVPARQTFTSRGGSLHNETSGAKYHIAGIVDTSISANVMKFYYSGSTTDLDWKFSTPV